MVSRQEFLKETVVTYCRTSRSRHSSCVTEESQAVKLNRFEPDICEMQIRW